MADPTGFEPAISSVTGWHVGPLHHGSVAANAEDSRWRSGLVAGPAAGVADAPPILAADEPHRPPLRHRHPAHRRDAPGDGRRRGRRRRLRRRPDRDRARGARRRAARQGSRAVRDQRHHGQPRRPAGPRRPRPGDRSPAATSHIVAATRRPATRSIVGRSIRDAPRATRRNDRPGRDRRRVPRPDATRTSRSPALVTIENTHAHSMGQPLRSAYTAEVGAVAHERGVPLHVDGARFFNAVVALGVSPTRARRPGRLGHLLPVARAWPARSARSSSAAADFIWRARRARKLLGGGMRQAGVLAAPGLLALRDGPAGHDRAPRRGPRQRPPAGRRPGRTATGSCRPATSPSPSPACSTRAASGRTSSCSGSAATARRSWTRLRARDVLMVEYPHGQVRAVTHHGDRRGGHRRPPCGRRVPS